VGAGEPVAVEGHDDSPQSQAVEYEVRRLRPEEAIEVARCVYDSYGYSYAGEQAYQPERIAALNESGDLISAVAVTADGEVIGHSALVMHDELPPEVAMAAPKRSARGLGIATKLCAFLIDQLRLTGAGVLQARQVTVHPYTQRFCSKLGFLDCGFLLAHSPKSQSWRGMDTVAQRNSDIVGVLILEPREPVTLFPPQRHAQIIERLLEQVHVPATLVHEPQSSGSEVGAGDRHGQSVVHVAVSPTRSLAEIHIAHYGTDVVEALRRELYWLRREDVRVVELYVDLSIPVAAQLAPTLEDLGFMFTGVMPKTEGHHAMIMQFLNGVQVDYDELHVVSDMARELLAYIRVNDPFAV
jgi:serine/threonine-protein kinase RsbW